MNGTSTLFKTIVFLSGQAETDELRKWAGDLARNTEAVVAVANRVEVPQAAVWAPRIEARLLRSVFACGAGVLVVLAGVTGYVQQLNVRTTILMTLDGNRVQIPNATVYKRNRRNFTSSANRREDFVVGIDNAALITDAQEMARRVLASPPAALQGPEPSVLVDSLGPSAVKLRVYFRLNGREHSWLKVRSSVIRRVKRAFQQQGITMPDDAREVIFPQGVPVTLIDRTAAAARRVVHSP